MKDEDTKELEPVTDRASYLAEMVVRKLALITELQKITKLRHRAKVQPMISKYESSVVLLLKLYWGVK